MSFKRHFLSMQGKLTANGKCPACLATVTLSGLVENGKADIHVKISDAKCIGKIARHFISGSRRDQYRQNLQFLKAGQLRNLKLRENGSDSPTIPSSEVLRKIKSENNVKDIHDVIDIVGGKKYSIVSTGFNFSVEINKEKIIAEYAYEKCPTIYLDATGSICRKPKGSHFCYALLKKN